MAERRESPQAARLRAGQRKAVELVRRQTLAAVTALWQASPGYRDGDVERLVARLVPMIQAGQLTTARLTTVYLAKQAAALRGIPYAPEPVDADAVRNLRGVPAEEVYRRPAVNVYTALAAGKSFEAAKAAGLHRLLKMAATDLQMAKVHQADKSLRRSGATMYRRITTGNETCEICDMAAEHYYYTGNLAPIHTDCDCDIEEAPPNWKGSGRTAAEIRAGRADADAQAESVLADGKIRTKDGTSRAAVFEDLTVSEHGETGPSLHWRQHGFTTKSDLD